TAAGLHDLFQTPFGEEGKMAGIQIHASVVDGILSNSFIRPGTLVSSVMLLLISTLLVCLIGVHSGFWWSLVATATVGLVDTAIVAGAFRNGVGFRLSRRLWRSCFRNSPASRTNTSSKAARREKFDRSSPNTFHRRWGLRSSPTHRKHGLAVSAAK